MRNEYKIIDAKLKGKDHLEDLDIDGRMILKLILQIQAAIIWTGFIWLRIGTIGILFRTR
jgi:hypothetical protein